MNVAFIPVRGGSKSIPLKNIKDIAGKPLVYWVAKAANECTYIDAVYIATDNDKIKEIVEKFGLQKVIVIGRAWETATDTASTESAMLEFALKQSFDNIILIQATSPLLTRNDLEGGFELYKEADTDSVLSVVRQKRFQWGIDDRGFAYAINYDIFSRPRRQEFDGYLVENGAFYITSKERLLETGNRVSGNIKVYEMEASTYLEIDEPDDWPIIERKLELRGSQEKKIMQIPEIKMFLMDCDGCLTDGGMYYSEMGDELKKFNTKDGMGIRLLRERGILVGIITGENVALNRRRSGKLGLDILEEGVQDKLSIIIRLCRQYGIELKNVAYVGDDLNDLDVIKEVGFGCCVADGIEKVKQSADYVTMAMGGQGAVREVAELILESALTVKLYEG